MTTTHTESERRQEVFAHFDRWQTMKGLTVAAVLVAVFLTAPWPRELAALAGAGILLLSRRLHSRHMLGLIDWELLVLFIGLFVVNHAFQQTGLTTEAVRTLAEAGLHLEQPGPLFVMTFVLSNIVSNVPAVMLLLPVATHPMAGMLLALASTLAGNLLIVGSIANIIVVDAAERRGMRVDWHRHAGSACRSRSQHSRSQARTCGCASADSYDETVTWNQGVGSLICYMVIGVGAGEKSETGETSEKSERIKGGRESFLAQQRDESLQSYCMEVSNG